MVGEAPYMRPCNACGKQIILGLDADTRKWRPWDDYNAKVKHNCSARAVSSTSNENIASTTMGVQGTGAKSEEVATVHARVTDANTKLDMLMFLAEKIANKLGVELDK